MNNPVPVVPPMLIIGAGHVGGRVAQALREFGWTGGIELIGAEPHLPYERPPLSKALLTGDAQATDSAVLRPEAMDTLHLTHRVDRVSRLDPAARTVTLASGTTLAYTACVLATGGTLRTLSCPGSTLPGVLGLRTLDDAAALAPRLRSGAQVVVVGGGFIGLEVAASARVRGCRVTVIEGGPRLLGRAVPESLAASVHALHQSRGVEVRVGVAPVAFEPMMGGAIAVQLSDGEVLAADTVVVGIGIEPDVALAREAGLSVKRGIVVDRELQTSVPGVFAAGDVAEFPSPLSGELIRQETWQNAETQARTVACNLLGQHRAYAEPAWFWSDQYDHQLQVAGEPALAVRTVTRTLGESEGGLPAVLHFHLDADGRVVGASGFGPTRLVAKDLKLARMMVERRAHPDAADLASGDVKLKSLLAAVPA